MVECTALEMRHTGNRIGGSNPSLSASLVVPNFLSSDVTGKNLHVSQDFRTEPLNCFSDDDRRQRSLLAIFLSTSGLPEFGTDFLCD